MARENWRAAADYILDYHNTSTLPDAVIAHVDYTHLPLEWYLREETTFDQLPVFFPFGGALQPDDMETVIAPPLNGLVGFGTQTAWLTQSHLEGIDDQRLVEQWFADHYPIVTEQYPSGVKLSGYTLQYHYPALPEMSENTFSPSAELASGIILEACEILQHTLSAEDAFMHPPSGWLHVRLWWRAVEDGLTDYVTTAKIVGPDGVWGEKLQRPGDLSNYWPSSEWIADEYVREEVDVNLNPITPAGEYRLMVGLASVEGGEPIAEVDCGSVTITN